MSTTILGTLDQGGDGRAVLLAAVNQATGQNFTLTDFDFLDPEPVTIPTPTRNTLIRLAPLAHSGWYGTRKVYYNRIHVTELGTIAVTRGIATTVVGLLPQINEKYGILITEQDIYDAPLPAALPGETSVEVDFNFRPTSIIYYGGTKIVLGTNDPNAPGGNTSLPFAGQTTVFAYHTTLNGSGIGSVDISSVTIDADKARKRFASLNVDSDPPQISDIYRRRVEGQMVAAGSLPAFPIVDSWKGSTGTFCADGSGLVYKLSADSTAWVEHGNILQLDLSVPATALSCLEKPRVTCVKQGASGSLWAVAVVGGHNELFKSTDDGVTWDEQTVIYTEMFSIGTTPADYVLHDCMVQAGKLWFLFTTDTTYQGDAPGTPGALGVEAIDLVTLQSTTANLWGANRKNGQGPLVPRLQGSRFTFMTPALATVATPTVVGLIPQTWTTAQLYLFRPESAVPQGYSVYEVRHQSFERDILSRPGTYLQAYATALVKNDQIAIETIEVGSLVESATFNAEQWISDEVRTAQGYFTFGVKVLTRVAQGALTNSWVLTSLPMGNGNVAYPLLMTEDGKRMHYAVQPEHAITRVRFTEDNTIAGFVPSLDSTMVLEKHAGFTNVSRHGTSVWTRPGVSETLNTNYGLTAYVNTETGKAAIEFSFSGVDSNGVVHWLTSPSTATPLAHRTVGIDYAGMSEVPLAVASQGTQLLYWSATNGIYSSSNAGRAWSRYSEARLGYDASTGLDTDLVGRADFAFRPQDFRKGSFLNDVSIFELHIAREAKVYDKGVNEISSTKLFDDRVLFVTDVTIGQTANSGFDLATSYGGYGVNLYDGYSPKRVQHWESDGIATSVVTDYTTDPDQPLMAFHDDGLLLGVEVELALDVKRDVKFLDVDSLVWGTVETGGNTIHRLEWIKTGAVVGSLELLGGSNVTTAGFEPEVAHFLWQYQETNYVPLVYYGNKKVLLVGRLNTDGEFACTLHNLAVQGDNGAPLVPVPMLSKNRRDYLYAQKGNGIFRLDYTYDALNKIATFSLVRVFTLTGSEFSDISVVTGTELSAANAVPPTVPLIPTNPVAGTELSTFCDGTTLMANIADGNGGYTVEEKEVDSVDCGYVAPGPTPVGSNSATITLNTDTSNTSITNTDLIEDEGGFAYSIYALDTALNADTTVQFTFVPGTAVLADIASFAQRAGTSGAWTTVTLPSTLTIPAGVSAFGLRIEYAADATTEGDQAFEIIMEKTVGNTQITSDAVVTQFTITDTSTGTPPPSGGDTPPSYTPPPATDPGSQGIAWSDNYTTNNKTFAASGNRSVYYDGLDFDSYVNPQNYDSANGYLTLAMEPRQTSGDLTRPSVGYLIPLDVVYHHNAKFGFNINLPTWIAKGSDGNPAYVTGTQTTAPVGGEYIKHGIEFSFYDELNVATPLIVYVQFAAEDVVKSQALIVTPAVDATRPYQWSSSIITNIDNLDIPLGGNLNFEFNIQQLGNDKQIEIYLGSTLLARIVTDHFPGDTPLAMLADLSHLGADQVRLRDWTITGLPALNTWTDLTLDTNPDPAGLGITTSASPVNEGDIVNLVYRVNHPLALQAPQSVWMDIPAEAGVDANDYEDLEYFDFQAQSWTPYTMGDWIPLVRMQEYVIVRFTATADGIDEGGSEQFKVRMHSRDIDGLFPATFAPAPLTVMDSVVVNKLTATLNTGSTPGLGGIITTVGPTDEATWVNSLFDLSEPAPSDFSDGFYMWVLEDSSPNEAVGSDVQGFQRWNLDTNAWVSLGFGDLIPIKAGQTQIAIRSYIRGDFETEVPETLKLVLYATDTALTTPGETVHTIEINANNT